MSNNPKIVRLFEQNGSKDDFLYQLKQDPSVGAPVVKNVGRYWEVTAEIWTDLYTAKTKYPDAVMGSASKPPEKKQEKGVGDTKKARRGKGSLVQEEGR